MMDQIPNDRFSFRELSYTLTEPLEESYNPVQDVLDTTTSPSLDTLEHVVVGGLSRHLVGSCS